MIVRIAIAVSISWARPIPTGLPVSFLIFAPALRTSSHVLGPFGRPTWPKRSWR